MRKEFLQQVNDLTMEIAKEFENEPIKSMRVLSGFLGNIFLKKLKETKIILYSWSGIEKEVK